MYICLYGVGKYNSLSISSLHSPKIKLPRRQESIRKPGLRTLRLHSHPFLPLYLFLLFTHRLGGRCYGAGYNHAKRMVSPTRYVVGSPMIVVSSVVVMMVMWWWWWWSRAGWSRVIFFGSTRNDFYSDVCTLNIYQIAKICKRMR